MNPAIGTSRSPSGDPLDPEILALLRALIAADGARRLVYRIGVSLTALERAASGGRVLRGTSTLIAIGIDRMRAEGELPKEATTPRKVAR
jgi:hypothetical protein